MPASEEFYRQYVITALWLECPGSPDENDDRSFSDRGITIEKLQPETAAKMRADCDKFYDDPANAADLAAWRERHNGDVEAGHDFWLTRNGHGMGFWDRFNDGPLEAAGNRLTAACDAYNVYSLDLADDGTVYGV